MVSEKTRQQALFLFQFGKRMRDHMLKTQMSVGTQAGSKLTEELSPAQIHMLMNIKGQQECTISTLASLLEVSSPSVSAMVDRLVDKGALIRERSRTDRRVVVVRLAPEVADQMAALEKELLNSFITMIEKIGPELTDKWCTVITQITEVLQEDKQ